ncbi:MAG: hypothetical protein JEY94_02120 [Melioribacteraceae bacterium]|nr:hypothetical protein [Melioribacteraceae bacterium]
MIQISKRQALLFIVVLLAIIVVLNLLVPINHTVSSTAKVYPASEWIISRGIDGFIYSRHKDNVLGTDREYSTYQLERGDALSFKIDAEELKDQKVEKGDTLGIITSSELERNILEVERNIIDLESQIIVSETGEKKEVLEVLRQNLIFAEKEYIEQKKIYDRAEKQFQKDLISEQEFEIEKGKYELYKINIDKNKAELERYKTGLKPEEIKKLSVLLESYKKEYKLLCDKKEQFVFCSPINGLYQSSVNSDTLMIIADTSSYVFLFPVELSEAKYIKIGSDYEIVLPDLNYKFSCEINNLQKNTFLLNGRQAILLKTELSDPKLNIYPNMYFQCEVDLGKISLFEYIKTILMK